jgi:predicted helicase
VLVARTIAGLLDKIYFTSGSEAEKGSRFEKLIVAYLQTAGQYAGRFSDVRLWQDWEGRQGEADTGIDIVATDKLTGELWAIQCKFYSPNHYLDKAHIDSFFTASGKQGFSQRLIVSTTDRWSSNAEAALVGQQIPVTRIGLADLLESDIDWAAVDFERPSILPTTTKKRLRPHQKQALVDVFKGFETYDRGKLIMACGTGKTFTALKIAEQLATEQKAKPISVLFLVPSISLLNQSLREWTNEAEVPFRAFAVCSDTKVGKRVNTEDISAHDLIYPATTDTAVLVKQMALMAQHQQFTVVFSTYQSIETVAAAQAGGMADFDLIVCDEAHRTTGVTIKGEDDSAFVRVHDQSFIRGDKRLYMTATPRLFDDSVKKAATDADAVLCSMDDEALFGPELHRLGFGDAVAADLLSDYKVMVLAVDEQYVSDTFQREIASNGEIQLGDAVKIVGCWNGLAKRFLKTSVDVTGETDAVSPEVRPAPMRRAVAFARDIKASKAIAAAFPDITDAHIAAGREQDGLRTEIEHVDGTYNALRRAQLLGWLKAGAPESDNVCRILTNAKCLSEGVDVPALDAVMFLTPRSSVVDVVQSVGRVMRKAPGKDVGYIILPIGIPAGMAPEEALKNNEKYKVVWQVLQALRAHDDRFNATINRIELNKARPDQIQVIGVPGWDGPDGGERKSDGDKKAQQLALNFDVDLWRDAIYARIVAKCGDRRYWETWAGDIADIATAHITRITSLLGNPNSVAAGRFDAFLAGLRGNLNDGITRSDAIEMLAQHLITRPVFDALFEGYEFGTHNPVAQTMQAMLDVLDEHTLDAENATLEQFYASVRQRAKGVDNAEGRQRIIVELYDKFFATAFKKTVDKLGIVYTPVEIVDFILHSADWALRREFGQGLTDEGVHILDGFTGTGTFIVRLLQSGLITPHDLARKYANELHANEILLLAYYIAAVNIETAYQDLAADQLGQDTYLPFEGLVLADTFQMHEDGDVDDLQVFPENNERLTKQRDLDIRVIVGNPPYSAGQDSANDNNQNEKYPHLDSSIRDSYAARSTASTVRTLYDSYIRAIRWATLRIKDRGVIAFVTNGGFLDTNTADGLRLTLADEFTQIYVYNLRGNQRTAGEQSRREGGKVFDAGSRATVAITVLVKNPVAAGPARIHYCDIGDYLTRKEKLRIIGETGSLQHLDLTTISPNAAGDWLNQRNDEFGSFIAIGEKDSARPTVFAIYSLGLASNRDAWVYNSSSRTLRSNIATTIDVYNAELVRWLDHRSVHPHSPSDDRAVSNFVSQDPKQISWSSSLISELRRGRSTFIDDQAVVVSAYRPFFKQRLYFSQFWNNRTSQLPRMFPTSEHANCGFYVVNPGAGKPFSSLMTDQIPDLAFWGSEGGQFFSRHTYEVVEDDGALFGAAEGEVIDGYRRIDNITDEALARFHTAYGPLITKDDVFLYVYGLLHCPDYRTQFAADLKKMLPRIPLVANAVPFIQAGRALSKLHLGYELAQPYQLDGLGGGPMEAGDAAYQQFRVEKMRFGKPTAEQKQAGLREDRSTIVYNDHFTLRGVPEEAYRYMLGSRSAIEWIMERYQVKVDKASGIRNDPNDWSREVDNPRYILDLLARIATVSLETMTIVDALPALDIPAPEGIV